MKPFYSFRSYAFCVLLLTAVTFHSNSWAQFSATSSATGTVATVSVTQGFDWTNPSNVQASDGAYATSLISGSNRSSYYLDAKNWGFQSTTSGQANYIPPGATINGFEVNIRVRRSSAGTIKDRKIILLKAGVEAGSDRSRGTSWPTTATTMKFGSSVDLWGTTWTATDLTNANFGIRLQARNLGNKTAQAEIDHVSVTVYFNQVFYYSKSSGNLELTGTWGTNTDGTGTAPSNFTNNGQIFVLRNRATATLTANLAISGTKSKFVVGDGTTATAFTIPSNFTLTALTDVAAASSLAINNATSPTLGGMATNTTVSFSATANQPVPEGVYYNLSLAGSGNKLLQTGTTGITSITNVLIIASGVTLNNQGNQVTVTGVANGISNNGTATGTGRYTYSLLDVSTSITGTGIYNNLEVEFATTAATRSLTLSNPTTITGTLTLTDGTLANGSQLTMSPGSTLAVADGTLGSDITASTGYDVIYNPYSSASPKSTGAELSGTPRNFTLQTGSGLVVALSRNLVISGNLLLTSGSLDPGASNFNMTLAGNFTNNATLVQRNNVVTFNGTSPQTINAPATQSFYDVTINGAGGNVTLNVPTTITHTLTLTNGLVTTSATNLLTLAQTATATAGGNATSYVNGPLAQVEAALSAVRTFPIGKNNAYRPVSLSINQAAAIPTTYTAEMFPGPPPARTSAAGINKVSTVRYFTVSSSNNANLTNARITINYGPDDGVTDPSNLRIAKSNGSNWTNIGGTGTAAGTGSIVSGLFTSFSDFVLSNAVGGGNVLPLVWVSFIAAIKEGTIELKWKTGNEINTSHFKIERSNNSTDWVAIGHVATNNDIANEYIFNDPSPGHTVNYYRIRLLDLDGRETFSKVIRVSFSQPAQAIVIAPNPARGSLIRFFLTHTELLQQDYIRVRISDMSGRIVFTTEAQPAAIMEITPRQLPPGRYVLHLGTGPGSIQSGLVIAE